MTKTCPRCGVEKDALEGFYSSPISADGCDYVCKACKQKQAKEAYKAGKIKKSYESKKVVGLPIKKHTCLGHNADGSDCQSIQPGWFCAKHSPDRWRPDKHNQKEEE